MVGDCMMDEYKDEEEEEDEPRLLPDDSWITIVCGVSKEWGRENGEELPPNFFVAPRDVYMPDLTAVADVLLGKLVRRTCPSLSNYSSFNFYF